jgi:hypothetical protein
VGVTDQGGLTPFPVLVGGLDLAGGDPTRYAAVAQHLRQYDPYMVCADFDAYVNSMASAAELYREPL